MAPADALCMGRMWVGDSNTVHCMPSSRCLLVHELEFMAGYQYGGKHTVAEGSVPCWQGWIPCCDPLGCGQWWDIGREGAAPHAVPLLQQPTVCPGEASHFSWDRVVQPTEQVLYHKQSNQARGKPVACKMYKCLGLFHNIFPYKKL